MGDSVLNIGSKSIKVVDNGDETFSLASVVKGINADTESAVIASGESLSAAVDLGAKTVWGIIMPAAWDAASMTFEVSNDGTTYVPLYYDGSEFTLSEAAASRGITINPLILSPWRYIQVRSGTAASAVNQTAERTITLLTKDM